jgi:hypothetical protein
MTPPNVQYQPKSVNRTDSFVASKECKLVFATDWLERANRSQSIVSTVIYIIIQFGRVEWGSVGVYG